MTKEEISKEREQFNTNLGIRMRFYREDKGMGVQKMADELGVSRSHIYKMENGTAGTSGPTAYEVYKYCRALDAGPELLLNTRQDPDSYYMKAVKANIAEKYPALSEDLLNGILSVISDIETGPAGEMP